ncbi:MAG TPA: YncE family protein [Methylomirabilota bacterium]|nr:YncE family protein [Methylomirabilota bacterium]
MQTSRRTILEVGAVGALALAMGRHSAQAQPQAAAVEPQDRVFIANGDSNTISVLDPRTNTVETTINLTSFDEDPRPPFRFANGGVASPHAAMIHKPLYRGAIGIHGLVPSPDNRVLATVGRGSSNVYLIDVVGKRVIGNTPNPQAGPTSNPERLTGGILVGREPHGPTFTRNGRELWVTLRGEDRVAVIDVEGALKGNPGALRLFVVTLNGPSQVWFSADGSLAFVASQKAARVDVLFVNPDAQGRSRPSHLTTLDISAEDPPGFTSFLKTSPDSTELWLTHKLADRVSVRSARGPHALLDSLALASQAQPNHLEFVENARGKVVYVSQARVDDRGPGDSASSRIAIVDRSGPAGSRKVAGSFFSRGRQAHGLWTNPANTLLYVAHEQDEPAGTTNAGQAVASAFDVTNPLAPAFLAQIPLGSLALPSGALRNKGSNSLVYVRAGARSQTA